jgi:DUF177 domain-containing protein
MKALSDYNIQFVGLKEGTHFFEFEIDNTFFEEFDCNDFLKATFKVDLEFIKRSTMLLLNFNFNGEITVPCDRCLDKVDVQVEGEETLIVKFGNEDYNETDEILVIPEQENELNVAKYIYEFIELNIPQKRVHQEGFCNPDAIKELEKVENKSEQDIDPRWAGLNDLKIEK